MMWFFGNSRMQKQTHCEEDLCCILIFKSSRQCNWEREMTFGQQIAAQFHEFCHLAGMQLRMPGPKHFLRIGRASQVFLLTWWQMNKLTPECPHSTRKLYIFGRWHAVGYLKPRQQLFQFWFTGGIPTQLPINVKISPFNMSTSAPKYRNTPILTVLH